MSTEIAAPLRVKDYISARTAMLSAFESLMSKEADLKSAAASLNILMDTRITFNGSGLYSDASLVFKKYVDFEIWKSILDRGGLTNAMTEKAKAEYLKKIESNPPEVNEENFAAFAQNVDALYAGSFHQTVKEVFKQFTGTWYDGPSRTTKRDNLQRIEANFKCRAYPIKWDTYFNRFTFEYSKENRFEDLLTACYLLDGKGVTQYQNRFRAIVEKHLKKLGDKIVTDYFIMQVFKNGNATIQFVRLDILEMLNRYGPENSTALPDSMRKRYKPEHFADRGVNLSVFEEDMRSKPIAGTNDYSFFKTPADVATRMCELADLFSGAVILEPSAGDGALVMAIYDYYEDHRLGSFKVTAVEYSESRCRALEKTFPKLFPVRMDFLETNSLPDNIFDRVIMNPPFNGRQEAVHVLHAFSFLKPGGVLVAIIPEGWFFRDDVKSKAFRQFLSDHGVTTEELPSYSFKESGANVRTRIIRITKPEAGA